MSVSLFVRHMFLNLFQLEFSFSQKLTFFPYMQREQLALVAAQYAHVFPCASRKNNFYFVIVSLFNNTFVLSTISFIIFVGHSICCCGILGQ